MSKLNFYELLFRILECYFEILSRGKGERYALAVTSGEFSTYSDENSRKLEEYIIATILGTILVKQLIVHKSLFNRITKVYENYQLKDFQEDLTKQEYEELSEKVEEVKRGLKNVVVDYGDDQVS